ncbi:hypothetical protein [Methylocaldum szegediense]|uniref:hypothetical protein n=1 Tax=Methylocaldum szegediense TaxID=73780 RepID=UPI000428BA81|nr:hypothetical protein [Methylocaldum szegediense]
MHAPAVMCIVSLPWEGCGSRINSRFSTPGISPQSRRTISRATDSKSVHEVQQTGLGVTIF